MQTDEKKVLAWDKWIAKDPEQQRLADEAVQVLLLFRGGVGKKIAEQDIKAETNRLTITIRDMKSSYYQPRKSLGTE